MNYGTRRNRDRGRRGPYLPQSARRGQRRPDRQWPSNLRHAGSLGRRVRRYFPSHRLCRRFSRKRLIRLGSRRSRWSGHAVFFRYFHGVVVVVFFAARRMHVALDV